MQSPLFCASCASPLEFEVPELTGARWHTSCAACGKSTALQAILHQPGELVSFSAKGVFALPKPH